MRAHIVRLCLSLPFVVLLSAAVEAADKASTVNWPVGASTISVTFVPPFPDTKYSVAVMPVVQSPVIGGYSPTTLCTYFGIVAKLPTTIRIQHKRCDNGALVPVDSAFLLDWTATTHTQ